MKKQRCDKSRCGKSSMQNIFLRGFFVVFVCFALNIHLFSVQSYAAALPTDGYKKTAELTDADRSDAYQKNYQQADNSTNTNFLYKTAEWTNKGAKEAKITLTAQEKVPKGERSAVYAFNVCEAHGFSKDIAKRNIDFLLKNFDRVDIVRTGVFDDETVRTIENIKSFDDVKWPSLNSAVAAGVWSVEKSRIINSHRNVGLYDGLRTYLKSHQPTCIYVSFDLFYVAQVSFPLNAIHVPKTTVDDKTGVRTVSDREMQVPELVKNVTMAHGIPETMNEDCFDILKHYKKEGRYFSMACDYNGEPVTRDGGTYAIGGEPENLVKVKGKAEKLGRERFFYSANIVAALADPTVWPGREAAKKGFWNGEPYNPVNPNESNLVAAKEFGQRFQGFKGIAPDYPYNKDLETLKVPVAKRSLRITDTVADYFEIIEATSKNPKAKIEIEGNTVSALLEDYDGTTPLTVTIRVKLSGKKRDIDSAIIKNWSDTNEGPAKMYLSGDRGETEIAQVNSPKLSAYTGESLASAQGRSVRHMRSGKLAATKPELESEKSPKSEPKPTSPKSKPPKPNQPKPASSKPEPPKPAPSKPAAPKPAPSKPAPSKPAPPKPAPSKPAPKPASAKSKRLPGTDDAINPWIWIGISALGVVGVAGVLSMRKREEN